MKALPLTTIGLVIFATFALKALFSGLVRAPVANELPLDLLTLACLVLAVRAFDREDPPRRAWAFLAGALAVLAAGHALFAVTKSIYLRHGFVVAHNVLWVAALVQFWRTLRGSGLSTALTRRSWWWVLLPIFLAVGAGLWGGTRAVTTYLALVDPPGERTSELFTNLMGLTADATVFVVAVLLARVVWEMRGGALLQPYLLLALGFGTLLATDLVVFALRAGSNLALGTHLQHIGTLGWALVSAAALSQRALLHSARNLATDALTPPPGTYDDGTGGGVGHRRG